jgi:KipI family sensor histidine kinase inhibitor
MPAIPGVVDAVPAYRTLVVICAADAIDPCLIEAEVNSALASMGRSAARSSSEREIPVCYQADFAPDLPELASIHALSVPEVIALHSGAKYTVEFLGFSPGFPYLSGLPERLATPRLERPRTRVPAGSVGIGGSQTGVYPQATPGGWRLIGRTPVRLFDPERTPPALLAPGDRVRFVPVSRAEFDRLASAVGAGEAPPPRSTGALRVRKPGLFSTVQDPGRLGHAAIGVSHSGAADEVSLRIGNRLVGNADSAAAVEMTLTGIEAEFARDATAVVTGAAAEAGIIGAGGERPLPHGMPQPILRGERVRIGRITGGARAYLCIAGGIATRPILGSRATHAASGLGGLDGRALRAGDELPLGDPAPAPRRTDESWRPLAAAISRRTLRITRGPHTGDFDDSSLATLQQQDFVIADQSDRTGIRLLGPTIRPPHGGRMLTEGTPPGAIQVTESGMPILLGPDRPTTGGYPVLACIASIDLPALGQLAPREHVRFELVSFEEARRLYHDLRAALDSALPVRGPGAP